MLARSDPFRESGSIRYPPPDCARSRRAKTRWLEFASRLCNTGSPHSALPLGLSHARLIHAKVMRDLMPDGIGDHLLQLLKIPRRSFMRTLVDGDPVGHREAVAYAAGRERMSLIQTEQAGAGRLALHDDGDVLQILAKARRNMAQGACDESVEFFFRQHVRSQFTPAVSYRLRSWKRKIFTKSPRPPNRPRSTARSAGLPTPMSE